MRHPWLDVPIADYEAHMSLSSVGQAQLLCTALESTVTEFQPRSLAVLGVAGGNGLQFVDLAVVRRMVALDFNPDYLALCSRRFAASFTEFEPVLHDLSHGSPVIEPVECIFAGPRLPSPRAIPCLPHRTSCLVAWNTDLHLRR